MPIPEEYPTIPPDSEDTQSDIKEQQPQLSCKMSATSGCEGDIVGICVICREPFCDRHQSDADLESCSICTDFQTIETQKDPLVDDEGVQHKGAVIHPIGYSYRTLMRRIVEMDDYQLEAHIVHVKQQVKEAGTVLEYRRIDLSSSQVELEERGVAKSKKLRIRGMEQLANGNKVVGMPSVSGISDVKRQKALDNVAATLKKTASMLGIKIETPQQLADFALKVKSMGVGVK
jgi:hypothetical protein